MFRKVARFWLLSVNIGYNQLQLVANKICENEHVKKTIVLVTIGNR